MRTLAEISAAIRACEYFEHTLRNAFADELDGLAEQDRQDAERYRFIRNTDDLSQVCVPTFDDAGNETGWTVAQGIELDTDMDTAINAARKDQQP